MKRTLLFVGIISMTLLLSSCLDNGGRSYEENTVVYLASSGLSGRVYGRTLSGRLITSPEMQLMQVGSFQYLHYSWLEDYGYTPIDLDLQADNVALVGEPVSISRINLRMNQQPPQVETPVNFLDIVSPVYAEDEVYLGDHWLFQYAYEIKKGQNANVNFYYMPEEGDVTDNKLNIFIDLSFTGEPESGASTTTKTDILALDMSDIRAMYEGTGSSTNKSLTITFSYYLKGRDQIVVSQECVMKVRGN